jgi:small GTP-binding protein
MMAALKTGIPKMDDLLGEGLPQGSTVLLTGALGADIETFSQQIASTVSQGAGPCVYFVSDKRPEMIREKIKSLHLPLSEGAMSFIDGYSASIGMATSERFSVSDLSKLDETISVALADVKPTLLVFDAISAGLFGGGDLLAGVRRLVGLAKSSGATSVFLFTRIGEQDERVLPEMAGIFDIRVTIESVAENFIERSFYNVSTNPSVRVPFKVSSFGVSLYVPKILVTGPFHAGKSTFIHKISTRAVSVDRLGTTVALDHGYVEYGGLSVDLFGTPGQEAFNFILPILAKDTFGIILIVDSTDRSCFPRAREMLSLVWGNAIPFVIAANKSDLPGSIDEKEMRSLLNIGDAPPVVRTVAKTGEGLMECLAALFNLIISQGGAAR